MVWHPLKVFATIEIYTRIGCQRKKKEKNHLSGSKEKVRPDNNYERVRRVYDIEIVLTTLLTENSFLKSSCCWIIPSTTKPVKKEMMESKLLNLN